MPKDGDLSAVRTDFIEKIGLVAQADGLPRIAGRLLGLLIFDGAAVSFGELAAKLQVSRGSISSASRILEERGLVRRSSRPGERQDYFQLAPNPYASMLDSVAKRLVMAKSEIDATIAEIPGGETELMGRLSDYAHFYEVVIAAVQASAQAIKPTR